MFFLMIFYIFFYFLLQTPCSQLSKQNTLKTFALSFVHLQCSLMAEPLIAVYCWLQTQCIAMLLASALRTFLLCSMGHVFAMCVVEPIAAVVRLKLRFDVAVLFPVGPVVWFRRFLGRGHGWFAAPGNARLVQLSGILR